MPISAVRSFTELVNGEVIVDDRDYGYTEVRLYTPKVNDRDVYIEFYYDHPESAPDYWSVFFGKTGEPVYENKAAGVRIFEKGQQAHFFVILLENEPTLEQIQRMVEFCLRLAQRR